MLSLFTVFHNATLTANYSSKKDDNHYFTRAVFKCEAASLLMR